MSDDVFIVDANRTPIGSFQGSLSSVKATDLGSISIKAIIERGQIDVNDVDEVYMGCVLPAGLGQAPARQAALGAGLPSSVGCTTVNKMCGSGLKAIMTAHDSIKAGTNNLVISGGLESMSNAPYLIEKARSGLRMGNHNLIDHMFYDGLEDAYDRGKLMGHFAEDCATKYSFTREEQDNFSKTSLKRAIDANNNGTFDWEIVPVKVKNRKGSIIVSKDEQPFKSNLDKISSLKPAFVKDGTVTAANSSSISDGASSVAVASKAFIESKGLSPLAKIIAHTTHSQEPKWFTTAPVGAIGKLLEKTNWTVDEVDLFEVNEAFSVVAMSAMKEIGISHEKLNIHGGACALGHPVGASGSRIVTTLIGALKKNNLKKGIASLCIGGGEAVAMAIELC